jgi:competence protein ComFB
MKNALEEVIRDVYGSLRDQHPQFCACERCQDDVMTYALNQTRPRYVQSDGLGAAVTRVALATDAARTEITVIVFDAMRRVAANPRHVPGDPKTLLPGHPSGQYPRFED